MVTPQIISYVREQIKNGLSLENIQAILARNGWSAADIAEVIQAASGKAVNVAPQGAPVVALSAPSPRLVSHHTFWTKSHITLIIVLAAAVVLGGGYFAYAYYEISPGVAVPRALWKFASVSSAQYQAQASLAIKTLTRESSPNNSVFAHEANYDIAVNSAIDFQNRKSRSQVSFETRTRGTELPQKGSFEIRTNGGVVYAQLTSLSVKDDPGFGQFKDIWIQANPTALAGEMQQFGMAEAASSTGFSRERMQTLLDIAKKYRLIDAADRPVSEDVDGVESRHYALTLNSKNIQAYFEEVKTTLPGLLPFPSAPLSGVFRNPHLDLWIASETGLPQKFIFTFDASSPADGMFASGTISLLFKSFNESVDAPVPPQSIDVLGVIGFLGNKGLGGTSASTDTDATSSPGNPLYRASQGF